MARKKNYQVYQQFFDYQTPYIALIMTLSAACALSVALMTFSQWDTSSFYHSTDIEYIHNWYGVIGASISSWLFHFIGYAAFCIPSFLFFNFYVLLLKDSLVKRLDQIGRAHV